MKHTMEPRLLGGKKKKNLRYADESENESPQLCLTLCDPMDCPWTSLGQNTGVGSLSLLQGIFPPGIEPESPALQADSLPTKLSGPEYSYLCWS